MLGTQDDRLFPGRPPFRVGEIVNFVEDDAFDAVEFPRGLEQHISEDFGRHHQDRRTGILGDVAGEQSDVLAIDGSQIAEFLIAECLDRCRVHHPSAAAERFVDPELGDDGLTRPGRRGDHDRLPLQESEHRLHLEGVEREGIEGCELFDAFR